MSLRRLVLSAILVLLIIAASIGTPADADLWGHLTFGRDIVETRTIDQADHYSFTSDRLWINHEWLSEVSFAEAYRALGPSGLILLKCAVIAALMLLVWRYVARLGLPIEAQLGFVALACVATYWRTHSVRPQLFSVLFFAALLAMLSAADRGRRRALLWIPPMMALWVNFHGGWIVGLGVLGLWLAARVLAPGADGTRRLFFIAIGLTSAAATLINPVGIRMWSFLWETVGFGRDDIEEWGSILTYPVLLGIPWLLSAGVAAWVLWRSGRPRHLDYLLVIAGLAVASFRVSRLDAFFGLAVVLWLAPALASALARAKSAAVDASARHAQTARVSAGVVMITIVVGTGVVASAAVTFAPFVSCVSIGGPWVPDADAAQFIRTNHLKGRMLTWFDWGEYAIWHFGPQLQVSLDGRRETVYTNATIFAHRHFYAADDTAKTYLQQLSPNYLWLPNRLPIVSQLPALGFPAVFTGSTSSVFARAGAGPFQAVAPQPAGRRCFPGL